MTSKKIREALESIGCTNWRNHSNVFVEIRNGQIRQAVGTLYAGSSPDVFKHKTAELKKALK